MKEWITSDKKTFYKLQKEEYLRYYDPVYRPLVREDYYIKDCSTGPNCLR